jgi:hypothetical protein
MMHQNFCDCGLDYKRAENIVIHSGKDPTIEFLRNCP